MKNIQFAVFFFLFAVAAPAQLAVHNQIGYTRVTDFTVGQAFGLTAISGDGSRIIYSTTQRKVYTMNSDGSGWSMIFDFETTTGATPFVAINEDGSRVAFTPGVGHISVANFDGSGRTEVASSFSVGGSPVEPDFSDACFRFAENGKLYFAIDNGIALGLQVMNGLYEMNADGSGLRLIFNHAELTSAVPVVPDEPNFGAHVGWCDVSDSGGQVVGSYEMQAYSGNVATRNGTVFTWTSGGFQRVRTDLEDRGVKVAISGNGQRIAYYHPTHGSVASADFNGSNDHVHFTNPVAAADVHLNRDGTLLSVNETGSGNSEIVSLYNAQFPWQRLDMMPEHNFGRALSVRMDASGTRLLWITGWMSPYTVGGGGLSSKVEQVMLVDLNPSNVAAFPVVANTSVVPQRVDRLALEKTAAWAQISGAVGLPRMSTLQNGALRPNFTIGTVNDDGLYADIAGGDGFYTARLTPSSTNIDLGYYSVRVTAVNSDATRMLASDAPGPQVFDGPTSIDFEDEDGDGVVRLLEEAFAMDAVAPDAGRLPKMGRIEVGDLDYPGVIFRVLPGGHYEGIGNSYRAAGLSYFMEISEDLLHWRAATPIEVVFLPATDNGDGSESVSAHFTTAFQNIVGSCYLRPAVQRGGVPFPDGSNLPGMVSGSTVLTFDFGGNVNKLYGYRVKGLSEGTFSYGGVEGFTPNIETAYSSIARWVSGYGDLTNIIYASSGTLNVDLNADAGFEVRLSGFDLATTVATSQVINSISVLNASGGILWQEQNVSVPSEGHLSVDFGGQVITGHSLSIRIDALNLGSLSDEIGLDNVRFSEVPRTTETDWTVLTFQVDGVSDVSQINPAYGDFVSSSQSGTFHYAGGGNYTPNVAAEYYSSLRYSSTGFGTLRNVLYTGAEGISVVLKADSGKEVMLRGFDLAARYRVETVASVTIFDEDLKVIYSETDVVVPMVGRLHFDLTAAPPISGTLIVRVDLSNLGNYKDDVAIDNVSFSQIPNP